VWLIILSDQLTIAALVGRYPTNKQITHALLTRAPLYYLLQAEEFSYDLHVLSTPPAFILSQDQTLQLNRSNCLKQATN